MSEADTLDEHGEDFTHARRRRRTDPFGTERMGSAAELLAGRPVRAGEGVETKANTVAQCTVGENSTATSDDGGELAD